MAAIEKIRENAAGIDLGTEMNYVSIDGETVKSFGTFTSENATLVQYLKDNGIKTVVIESTGVIWLPIYDAIEAAGIEVFLVNAAHAKNVPGQKSDPADCRWLQQLHTFGLLRPSFVPKDAIRTLRTFVRMREDHIEMASSHIMHMQKAFELMNLKLKNVISQLHGVSGMRIVKAIIEGERDAVKLVELCDVQIKKNKKAEVIESLKGNYKDEYIFMLKQGYDCYNFYQQQIKECEKQIEDLLFKMTKDLPPIPASKPKQSRHNCPDIKDMHDNLVKVQHGRNAASIPGFSDTTILKLTAEFGTDFSLWPTKKHFTSYNGLSPKKCQSGKTKKIRRNFSPKTKGGQIFRECVMSIASSKNLALKGFYNRIKSKHGKKAANKATARKLAEIYYDYMTKGFEYVEKGLKAYENKYKEIMINSLNKKASSLGFQLVKA